jgi:hypothetical protein
VPFDVGHRHLFFRLTAYSDCRDCTAQFSTLDLSRDDKAFENLIGEGHW